MALAMEQHHDDPMTFCGAHGGAVPLADGCLWRARAPHEAPFAFVDITPA